MTQNYTVDEIKSKMLEHFGFADFKSSWQKEAVMKIYEGHENVIVSLPTHGGKSLTFQIQSVLCENKTILVFCLSLAIIKNQLNFLCGKGFNAESFNSHTDYNKRNEIIIYLNSNPSPIQFLYITPEMFASNFQLSTLLKGKIENGDIQMIVVDEAHTIHYKRYERPAFKKLGKLRQEYPDIQWVALTTISDQMLPKICISLKMEPKSVIFIQGPVARENIHYDVVFTKKRNDWDSEMEKLVESIHEFSQDSNELCGIIFVKIYTDTVKISNFLRETEKFQVEPYYADIPDRFEIQERWMNGQTHILVATVGSFGFGVIRNSVKFVIHMTRLINLRDFYQESGRAGVDGEISYSRVIAEKCEDSGEMIGYIWTNDCRRRYICTFFNEGGVDCVAKCDNCIKRYKK